MRAQGQTVGNASEPITLRLRGIDGKTYDLSQMRGQVVLVSFGATWCEPCADELRVLEQLKKEFAGRPVQFLWVSVESEGETPDKKLRDFAKAQRLSFPVLRDPGKFTYAQFSTRVRMPLIVFFDAQGRMSGPVHLGMGKPEEYKADMRKRLNQALATVTKTAGGQ